MLIIVDDSPELDAEIFNMEEFEGADWVRISDEVPVDESRRDELLEALPGPLPPRRDDRRTTDEDHDELEEDDQEVGLE